MPNIGFIDADTVEALLAVVPTDIGRALLDARTGALIESVTNAYRPPRAMKDFVATRDGTCRMWGCTRPAMACDTDHARPWPAGRTTPTNLGGLCRRHHRLKQRRRWVYQLDPDGTVSWTSPNGKRRMTYPQHAYWPPIEPAPPQAGHRRRASQTSVPNRAALLGPRAGEAEPRSCCRLGCARSLGRTEARAASLPTSGHSHSMVPGGLLVTSSTTRLTSRTSLVMRVEILASTS